MEFLARILQRRDLLKSEFLVQSKARCLIRRDVRQKGAKAQVPRRLNQCLEQLTPNPLTVKVMMHIDGVFQHARGGISVSERAEGGPANDASTLFGNKNRHGRAVLLIPCLAFSVRTRLRSPNASGVSHVIIENRVDGGKVVRRGRADNDVLCHCRYSYF